MYWTFDDMHIGKAVKDAPALSTRIIPRPPGLTLMLWYTHAKTVCENLNHTKAGIVDYIEAQALEWQANGCTYEANAANGLAMRIKRDEHVGVTNAG